MLQRRSNIVILVVLLVLAGAVVFVTQRGGADADAIPDETGSDPVPATAPLFPDIESDADMMALTIIDHVAGQQIMFERVGETDDWVIVGEDGDQPADLFALTSVLFGVRSLTTHRVLADVDEISPFGVLDPAYTIEVVLAGGENKRVDIGEKSVDGLSYYVLVDGEAPVNMVRAANLEPVLSVLTVPPVVEPTATPEA